MAFRLPSSKRHFIAPAFLTADRSEPQIKPPTTCTTQIAIGKSRKQKRRKKLSIMKNSATGRGWKLNSIDSNFSVCMISPRFHMRLPAITSHKPRQPHSPHCIKQSRSFHSNSPCTRLQQKAFPPRLSSAYCTWKHLLPNSRKNKTESFPCDSYFQWRGRRSRLAGIFGTVFRDQQNISSDSWARRQVGDSVFVRLWKRLEKRRRFESNFS